MRRPVPPTRAPLTRAPLALAPLALALAGSPAALQAQALGDPELTATISQRFEINSNLDLEDPRPGTSYFTDTRLAVGLLEETQTQSFSLGFDTGLRALWKAEEDFELTFASPSTARAAYAQEWATGSIDTSARYRQRRVDFARELDDFLDPDVIDVPDDLTRQEGTATERRYDASVGLALATDAPSSYAFSLDANRIDYSETAANRTPRTTLTGGATWSLQLNPTIASTLGARYFHYEADNPAETEIREAEVDAGVAYDPTAVLRVTAGLGYADRRRRDFGETTEDDSGVSFRSGLRYDFEEFVVNADLRVTTAAPDTRVSGNLALGYPLPRGRLNARVFQTYAGGTGGDEIRLTGAGIGLLQELDQVSRVNFDVAASRRENQDDPTDPDIDRIDFTTTFSYDFTEAVSADIGYRFRNRDEGDENASSHAVFVQVGRTFVTRP